MENGNVQYVVALDLGGTNSVFALVDNADNIKTTASIKTQAYDTAEIYVDAVVKVVGELASEIGGIDRVTALGIGAPAGNYRNGTIEHAADIVWGKGVVPIVDMLTSRLCIPVSITNDANAAAMGEMKYGVARGMENFIEITLGTGVGSGIVANGELVYGCDGLAGELGHVVVEPNGRQCGCGRRGCLDTYCSARGVVRTALEMLDRYEGETMLRTIASEQLTSYDVYKAAIDGDSLAVKVFDYTGEVLGRACANFAAFLSPEAFVFFGGLVNAGDLLLKPLEKAYDENVLSFYRGKARFLKSGLGGSKAAILGAAAMAWNASRIKNLEQRIKYKG